MEQNLYFQDNKIIQKNYNKIQNKKEAIYLLKKY